MDTDRPAAISAESTPTCHQQAHVGVPCDCDAQSTEVHSIAQHSTGCHQWTANTLLSGMPKAVPMGSDVTDVTVNTTANVCVHVR